MPEQTMDSAAEAAGKKVEKTADFEVVKRFLGDNGYKDYLESAASFNTRLLVERRMRLPFLDASTGIAQNSSALFFSRKDRMPGDRRSGKIYAYPSARWRKHKRQYLFDFFEVQKNYVKQEPPESLLEAEVSQTASSIVTDAGEESREPLLKEEPTKPADNSWAYYDDDLGLDEGDFEPVHDADSDYEYEETSKKKKKGKGKAKESSSKSTRGRKKGYEKNYEIDSDKPFGCDLCGARYKTRPGLSYHYTHIHKDHPQYHPQPSKSSAASGSVPTPTPDPPSVGDDDSSQSSQMADTGSVAEPEVAPDQVCSAEPTASQPQGDGLVAESFEGQSDALAGLRQFQDSFLSFLHKPGGSTRSRKSAAAAKEKAEEVVSDGAQGPDATVEESSMAMDDRAEPSPYCDFCLGDASQNRKTMSSEELVSCSDCGRSGHPTCLQFTANMIISVKKYRWQCIECKCCTMCGTSENDEQLLFCDDCDRGYHMYCLRPPLTQPPDGNWSCHLCIKEFHS